MTSLQLAEWVGHPCPAFQPMQICDHAKYLGVGISPVAPAHRWTKARNKFNAACAPIRASSQRLVQKLVPFKFYALSVLVFSGSSSELDKEIITAENFALQTLG